MRDTRQIKETIQSAGKVQVKLGGESSYGGSQFGGSRAGFSRLTLASSARSIDFSTVLYRASYVTKHASTAVNLSITLQPVLKTRIASTHYGPLCLAGLLASSTLTRIYSPKLGPRSARRPLRGRSKADEILPSGPPAQNKLYS